MLNFPKQATREVRFGWAIEIPRRIENEFDEVSPLHALVSDRRWRDEDCTYDVVRELPKNVQLLLTSSIKARMHAEVVEFCGGWVGGGNERKSRSSLFRVKFQDKARLHVTIDPAHAGCPDLGPGGRVCAEAKGVIPIT